MGDMHSSEKGKDLERKVDLGLFHFIIYMYKPPFRGSASQMVWYHSPLDNYDSVHIFSRPIYI